MGDELETEGNCGKREKAIGDETKARLGGSAAVGDTRSGA